VARHAAGESRGAGFAVCITGISAKRGLFSEARLCAILLASKLPFPGLIDFTMETGKPRLHPGRKPACAWFAGFARGFKPNPPFAWPGQRLRTTGCSHFTRHISCTCRICRLATAGLLLSCRVATHYHPDIAIRELRMETDAGQYISGNKKGATFAGHAFLETLTAMGYRGFQTSSPLTIEIPRPAATARKRQASGLPPWPARRPSPPTRAPMRI